MYRLEHLHDLESHQISRSMFLTRDKARDALVEIRCRTVQLGYKVVRKDLDSFSFKSGKVLHTLRIAEFN